MSRDGGLHVVASGHRHPATVLESGELEQVLPNVERGWINERLGMKTRRVAAAHERMADHGIGAVKDALERAGWTGADLDMIVCGASFLEDLMPARSSVIAEGINPAALAFDVNAACASFLYALKVADSLLRTDAALRRAAVCVVERPTASADYRDSHSSAFFGDSAAAVLVQREPADHGFALESLATLNDGEGSEAVRVPRHGSFRHNPREAFRHVVSMGEEVSLKALEMSGVSIEDVRFMVGHQANETVLGALGERLGFPLTRQWHNFEWAGNQGGAGVATAFSEGWHDRAADLTPGDHIVLNSVGSGYSASAAVLRWLG